MNCPYCNKEIYSTTDLQKVLRFQKHLRRCKSYVKRKDFLPHVNTYQALEVLRKLKHNKEIKNARY